MKADSVLNADMATLGRWFRSGLAWWIDELASLVPDRWRAGSGARGPMAWFDGAGTVFRFDNGAIGDAFRPSDSQRRMIVLLSSDICLIRTLQRPNVGDHDFQRMLVLDADRIMPMPGNAMLIAGRAIDRQPGAKAMTVEVAGLPYDRAVALAAATSAAGILPTRISLRRPDGASVFDFLPAMREAGLIANDRSAAPPWWALVGLLFMANIGLLTWRDSASVERLAELVEAQRPAVSATQRIAQRIQRYDMLARTSIVRREHRNALGLLGVFSSVLPDGAWIQRLTWDGATLRLAGYKSRDVNVVTALRRAPMLSNVRNTTSDAVAEIPAGQPFDVTARIGTGR